MVSLAEQYLQRGKADAIHQLRNINTARKRLRVDQDQNEDDAHMGDERARRFEDALSSLVDNLIPALDGEDEETVDDRHNDALDLAKNIIDE